MEKVKFEGEYSFRTSHKVLYNYISSPGGLQQWYADHVALEGENFVFDWDQRLHKAEMVFKRANKGVRFEFKDEDEGNYLEFKITNSDLDGTTYLEVTDYSDLDSIEDAQNVWNGMIDDLKDIVGG